MGGWTAVAQDKGPGLPDTPAPVRQSTGLGCDDVIELGDFRGREE